MNTANLVRIQRDAKAGFYIYNALYQKSSNLNNAILLQELAHVCQSILLKTKEYDQPHTLFVKIKVWLICLLAKLMGLTFTLRLFENATGKKIERIKQDYPELYGELERYNTAKKSKIAAFKEDILNHMGSIVLGLNDALVELSGALAGFTFALQNTLLIGVIGVITGFAATLSMATSEFLSQRHEGKTVSEAIRSCMYTGVAYLFTVTLLVLPYFLIVNPFVSLSVMMLLVLAEIFVFNFYNAVTTGQSFKRSFLEMALISLSVALLSFGVGYMVDRMFTFEL